MRVLIIGGGGREHAIAWKLKQSGAELFAAPGNAGIAALATCYPVAAVDIRKQVRLAETLGVDFVVVGPDDPLALGAVDAFREAGIPAFGPTAAAARLEASKSFAKEVMAAAGVPTAAYAAFDRYDEARRYLESLPGGAVVKADGLALGKGVVVAPEKEEALRALHAMMVERSFGAAGERVILEEVLTGPEVSVFAFCDGENYRLMLPVQDHKRVGEGDTGPNTGGMGAYTPVPGYNAFVHRIVEGRIIEPVLAEMDRRGTPYRGVLFAGLMLTPQGPKVLEFNARFGDPECQVLMAMLDGDLLEILWACAHDRLDQVDFQWGLDACACVVMASGGYPGAYEKGKEITGTLAAEGSGALVFHAGTARSEGRLVTAGGRVLNVVGRGARLQDALEVAYRGVAQIHFDGAYCRRDIGWRAKQAGVR